MGDRKGRKVRQQLRMNAAEAKRALRPSRSLEQSYRREEPRTVAPVPTPKPIVPRQAPPASVVVEEGWDPAIVKFYKPQEGYGFVRLVSGREHRFARGVAERCGFSSFDYLQKVLVRLEKPRPGWTKPPQVIQIKLA